MFNNIKSYFFYEIVYNKNSKSPDLISVVLRINFIDNTYIYFG